MRLNQFSTVGSRRLLIGAAMLLTSMASGCGVVMPIWSSKDDEKTVASMVINAGKVEESPQPAFKGAADMLAAEDYYQKEQWKKAGNLFEKVADDTKNPPLYAEKARFYEGECLRMRGYLVDAMATYNKLLNDFQYGVFREQAVGRMFEIANIWLDDTRTQLDLEDEKAAGKRWFVPFNFVHFEKGKPTFDEEGHALKALEQVYYNDPTGPYADKALFAAGYVHFRRGNFREADQLLSQLIDNADRHGKPSDFRDRAFELAILAKNNTAGGPHYDGRKAAESLKLIQQARMSSPELVNRSGEFLENQTKMVRYMQAEKDYEIAEFYRRSGHPASAWFYYELVRRRYQGTEFHDKAVARMKDINVDLTYQQQQSEFARATRRTWNKWMLGQDIPTLAKDQGVPAVPGESAPVSPTEAIVPVTNLEPAKPSTGTPPAATVLPSTSLVPPPAATVLPVTSPTLPTSSPPPVKRSPYGGR